MAQTCEASARRRCARCCSTTRELALIDVREERIFSESHLLFARSVPLSRLELRFARLVPRRATRIVLVDDADGLAERAAQVLAARRLFRRAASSTAAMPPGRRPAIELFSGVNVPSKAFGEFVEHENGTPSISAQELHDADAVRHRHGGARQPAVRRVFARLDSDRRERARRRAGAARPRHRAEAGDAGGGQLRRAHAQHHRRAVADQCGRAEQGRGAAQRHHGLEPRRLHAGQRQGSQRAPGVVAWRARLGEIRRRGGRRASSGSAASTRPRSRACAPTRPARSICSTCAIRPNTPPAMWRARSRRRAGSWCRRPINMPARCSARIVVRRRQGRCAP